MSASGDLDQFCESVPDLCFGESSEEAKVEECVHRCVVGTETVLVVAIVDTNLDGNRGIDESDDSGRNTNKVCVPSVGSTSKSKMKNTELV